MNSTEPRLSQRTVDVLRAVDLHWQSHGYAPSLRDICRLAPVTSTSVASHQLHVLRQQGLVAPADDIRARTCRLTRKGRAYLKELESQHD